MVIVFATLALCLTYVSRPAYVFDETYYYPFATGVGKWVANPTLDDDTLGKVFYEGNFHPPFPLYVMAITGRFLNFDIQDFLLSVRLATVLEFAALVLIIYLFVKSEAGILAGGLAAALTILSPRLFAHSLMATYDIPMTLWWIATTAAFYKGMSSRGWAIATGFIFGLALLTKINAFLLPMALWPWGIVFYRRKSVAAIVAMCMIGPAVLFAGWPWLWRHPFTNLTRYITDKLQPGSVAESLWAAGATATTWRRVIPTLYFGKVNAAGVPWHYPFVIAFMATPVATLFGNAFACMAPTPGKRRLVALLAWSALVQLLVFAFFMKPYDGERLFLPVLALCAMAGGVGLASFAGRGKGAAIIAVALVALSPGIEFALYEPYGMSYFTPLVGGVRGAEKIGMEVTYYGEAVTPAEFRAINERAAPGQGVAYAPMFKNLPYRMPSEYIRYGYLALGLEPAGPAEAWDYLIFVNRGGSIEASDRQILAEGKVIGENRLLGVMLSQAIERRKVDGTEGTDASGPH